MTVDTTTASAAEPHADQADVNEAVVPVAIDPGPGTWQRDAGHYPNPHSPLGRSIVYPIANRIGSELPPRMGSLIDGVELTGIGGWHYVRFVSPDGRGVGRYVHRTGPGDPE